MVFDEAQPKYGRWIATAAAVVAAAVVVVVIMLGYGQAASASMKALTTTVGGVDYHINSSTQLVGAFIDSISRSVLHSLTEN